jgi:hypothetical protein
VTDESRKPFHRKLGGMPGHVRPEQPVNFSGIRNGVEGNWFHSWATWEELVRPLIEKASDHGG